MSNGINKVIVLGNVGFDPMVRYMQSGVPVVNLSVATSKGWQDKETGDKKELTEWHRVVLFNKLAEIAEKYIRKGSKIYVEGSLRTRKWQNSNGDDVFATEILADSVQMLDYKKESSGDYKKEKEGTSYAPPITDVNNDFYDIPF